MLGSDLKLEKEEMRIYEYIELSFPHLLTEFTTCLSKARFMIMERLVNALLRESFFDKEEIERQLSYSKQLEFSWSRGKLTLPIAERYSYNRFKLEKNPVFSDFLQTTEILHPSLLIEVIKGGNEAQTTTFSNFQGFQAELSDSVGNMALSLLFQMVRMNELQDKAAQTDSKSIFALAEELSKSDPYFDESLFFEQLCVTGHLLHPCTKSKIGLTIEEIMQYSAEFDSAFPVHFAAIHKDIAYHNPKIKRREIHDFWLKEYPGLVEELKKRCVEINRDFEDFFLVPIHPWQKEHTLYALYESEIEKGQILFMDYIIKVKPTLSVRTVQPVGKRFHIKLPLNIQMTSAVRTISPNSIHNGPEITLMVNQILTKENYYNHTFNIIGEEIGLRFQSADQFEPNFRDRNKNLGYLIRKSPASFLHKGEHAIVSCALFNLSPVTNQLLLYELMDQFHLVNQSNSLRENVLLFFRKYVSVILSGVIPLMTKYGIGLEAHLQNTLIVLKKWEPVKVLIRDLGGVRIAKKRLEQQGFHGTYFPGSATINEDETGMQNKVIHTVFQSHIGELTHSLAKDYQLSEQILWDIVKEILTELFLELKKDQSIRQNAERDMAVLLGETVQTKALTLMRLKDDVTDYAFIDLPNPLR